MNWWYLGKTSTLIFWRRMIVFVRNFPLSVLFLPVLIGMLVWGLFLTRSFLNSLTNVYTWPESAFFYGRLFGLWGVCLFFTIFFILLWSFRDQKRWGQILSLPLFSREIWFGFYWLPFLLVNLTLLGGISIPFSAIGRDDGLRFLLLPGLGVFMLWILQVWGWVLYTLWGPWQQRRHLNIFVIVIVGFWHALPLLSFPFFLDEVHIASLLQSLIFERDIFDFLIRAGIQVGITLILWHLAFQYMRTYPRLLFFSKKGRWASRFLVGNSLFEHIVINEGKRLWRSQDRRFFLLLVFLLVGLLTIRQSSTEVLLVQMLPLLIGIPFLGALSQDIHGEWILHISPRSRIRYLSYKLIGLTLWAIFSSLMLVWGLSFLLDEVLLPLRSWGFVCLRIMGVLGMSFIIEGILRNQLEDLLGQILVFSSYFIGILTLDFSTGYFKALLPWFAQEYTELIVYLAWFVLAPFLIWMWEETTLKNPMGGWYVVGDTNAPRSFLGRWRSGR